MVDKRARYRIPIPKPKRRPKPGRSPGQREGLSRDQSPMAPDSCLPPAGKAVQASIHLLADGLEASGTGAEGGRMQSDTVLSGRLKPVDLVRCQVVRRLVAELFAMVCDRDLPQGSAQRRPGCHMRQIAMYLCHVVLSIPYQPIALAFSRDRSTVVHACAVVEDRRDDPGYDRFLDHCERCVAAVFLPLENANAGA